MSDYDVLDSFEKALDEVMMKGKENYEKQPDDMRRLKMNLSRLRVARALGRQTTESESEEGAQ